MTRGFVNLTCRQGGHWNKGKAPSLDRRAGLCHCGGMVLFLCCYFDVDVMVWDNNIFVVGSMKSKSSEVNACREDGGLAEMH